MSLYSAGGARGPLPRGCRASEWVGPNVLSTLLAAACFEMQHVTVLKLVALPEPFHGDFNIIPTLVKFEQTLSALPSKERLCLCQLQSETEARPPQPTGKFPHFKIKHR